MDGRIKFPQPPFEKGAPLTKSFLKKAPHSAPFKKSTSLSPPLKKGGLGGF